MLLGLTFAVAVTTALIATPIVRGLSIRLELLDEPGGRKIHDAPIPRLGGIAMVVAFLAALGVVSLAAEAVGIDVTRLASDRIAAIVAGTAILAGVGIVDDLRGMRAIVKLAAQILAAIVAWLMGLSIDELSLPWGSVELGVLALPATVLWVVAIINAINLIDGLDGLASGVVLVALGAFAVVAALARLDPALIVIAAVSGAAVGFLAYNLHPASIIMGDTGSMFLGFVVAGLSISLTQDASPPAAPWFPVLALAVPIADTAWAVVRRGMSGGSVFEADRGHIHHQLLQRGVTQRDAMLLLTAVSAVAATAAVLVADVR
jgi:UDP-GlcNAc:undecaprenyl-phosphate/decaprenyl-phosphate GlcNAc-1-phosphate transferase